MLRLCRAVVLAALFCAVCVMPAAAHQGNPNFRSILRGIMPAQPGVRLQVVNYDDSFQLTNSSGTTVIVEGYEREPYARVLGDGTVQVNRRSPAAYLNDERFGDAPVPASASATATPSWETLDRTGRFVWHDHRMHWMSRERPPAVRDPGVRTKVFDYAIPLRVDGRAATVRGTLYWVGEPGGSMPPAAIAALVALLMLSAAIVVIARRRRAHESDAEDGPRDAQREAW